MKGLLHPNNHGRADSHIGFVISIDSSASFCSVVTQDLRSLATVLQRGVENTSQDQQQYPLASMYGPMVVRPRDMKVHSLKEGTGIVTSWQLLCNASMDQGLAGQVLEISGLGVNQVSAMVIFNLNDGRHYQQVLTPEQPEFRVPFKSVQSQVMIEYSSAWCRAYLEWH